MSQAPSPKQLFDSAHPTPQQGRKSLSNLSRPRHNSTEEIKVAQSHQYQPVAPPERVMTAQPELKRGPSPRTQQQFRIRTSHGPVVGDRSLDLGYLRDKSPMAPEAASTRSYKRGSSFFSKDLLLQPIGKRMSHIQQFSSPAQSKASKAGMMVETPTAWNPVTSPQQVFEIFLVKLRQVLFGLDEKETLGQKFENLQEECQKLIEQASWIKMRNSTLYEKNEELKEELVKVNQTQAQQSAPNAQSTIETLKKENAVIQGQKENLELSLKSQLNVTSILEKKLNQAQREREELEAKLAKKIETEIQSQNSSKINLLDHSTPQAGDHAPQTVQSEALKIKTKIMQSCLNSLSKHKIYILKQLKVFKSNLEHLYLDIQSEFTRMQGADANLALVSISSSLSNLQNLYKRSQVLMDRSVEMVSLLHTDFKEETSFQLQIEEEPQFAAQPSQGVRKVFQAIKGNELSESSFRRIQEVLVTFAQYIMKMDKALGVQTHADVGAFHADLISKITDYHQVERIFEKYCAGALGSLEKMKLMSQTEVQDYQKQIHDQRGEIERLVAAFNVNKMELQKEGDKLEKADTVILKQLQEHIVMNNELQEKIKALEKIKSETQTKLAIQLINSVTNKEEVERHYKALIQLKEVELKETISGLHRDIYEIQGEMASLREEKDLMEKNYRAEIQSLKVKNTKKESKIEEVKHLLNEEIASLRLNLELYKENFQREKLNDSMVQGSSRKFDNTFTVAFESLESDENPIISDKIIHYLKMMLRLPDHSLRLMSVIEEKLGDAGEEEQDPLAKEVGLRVVRRFLFELNPSFEKIISAESNSKIKKMINSVLTSAKSGTSLLYEIAPVFVARNIGCISSGHCPKFDQYFQISRENQEFGKVSLLLSIYKHPDGFVKVLGLDIVEQQHYELNLNQEQILLLSQQNNKIFGPSYVQLLKTLILSSLNLLALDGRRFLVAEARQYFTDTPYEGLQTQSSLRPQQSFQASSTLRKLQKTGGGNPINRLIPSNFPLRSDFESQSDFSDLRFQTLARMTEILFEHGPFDLNEHKFKIILEKEKQVSNNLSITLVHLSCQAPEHYPLCLLHGSLNSCEFLLKQSSSIVDISGQKYFWFAEQRLSDKLLIIKFSTLRRRSDLCRGVTLAFQQSIRGSFLLQDANFEPGHSQLSQIVVKMGFSVDSSVQKGEPVILPDVQGESFVPKEIEEEKEEKNIAAPTRYQNVSHSQICFLRIDEASFQLRQVLFEISQIGDIKITCSEANGQTIIPAQDIEGMDLPTIVRILIANSQFLQVKNGRFYCDWTSLISHQKVMTIQPLKLAVDISSLSFDLSDLASLETVISFVQLNNRVFKGATKFVADVPSQGGINKALLPKYAQWKLVIISLDSRLLKKFYRLVFTENDAIELLIGLGYAQQQFSNLLNDFSLMSSILIRSLYFDQNMVSLLSSLQLAKERQGSIENLKDLIELNGVFAATSDKFKSPESFNTDDPYSSLKSTLIDQKKLRGLSDQSIKAFLKLIQVEYSGKMQYRVQIEEASDQPRSFKTSFTFSSSRDNQKFKLALYSAKLMRGSILVNLTILEDSFPHRVTFALTDNKGEVLWKFKKQDHSVNEILASSTKSWILKQLISKFSEPEEVLPLTLKASPFESLPSIVDSQDSKVLERDNKGAYFRIGHDERKMSYLAVNNLSQNTGVVMLESVGGGTFALGMSLNTVNIVAHTAFSAFSQCLLDEAKTEIQYSTILKGKERSDFSKALQFLVASFQFSPASLPLKKYVKNQGLHSQTMRNISLQKVKVLSYEVASQGLQCEVKISKVEVEQKPYILEIVVEDLTQKSNRQETYIAVNYLLPEIQQKEVTSNSEIFKKEVRKALQNSLVIMNSEGRVQFSIEKAKDTKTSNNTERLMTLFSDHKLLDHQIVNQEQVGKVEIEIFEKQELKKRMQKEYMIKVWNPEDYSLIAKKSLTSQDLEAIKASIRKQNEGAESSMEFSNVGSFLLEHIYLRRLEDRVQILFT